MKGKSIEEIQKDMDAFIEIAREKGIKEKSFHLYCTFHIVADSVNDIYGNGIHVKEYDL